MPRESHHRYGQGNSQENQGTCTKSSSQGFAVIGAAMI